MPPPGQRRDERAKRNTDRLREFTDASLPAIQRELYARVPVYPELEVLTLSFSSNGCANGWVRTTQWCADCCPRSRPIRWRRA